MDAIKAYEAGLRPEGLRDAAEVMVKMRQHFTTKDGEPDWKGRSWAYREAVREIYKAVGVEPEDLNSLQSAIRYHVGNVVREQLDESSLEALGLLRASPLQRTRNFRESREALLRSFMPTSDLDGDDVVRIVVMVGALLDRVEREIPQLDPPHLAALEQAARVADSRLAGVRREAARPAG